MKYKAKPVIITAVRLLPENIEAIAELVKKAKGGCYITVESDGKGGIAGADVRTLEGHVRANFGDYIILGTQNELYPCRADIFESKYELYEVAEY